MDIEANRIGRTGEPRVKRENRGAWGTMDVWRRILVIDNYDSFVYNLVQYLGQLGAEVRGPAQRRIAVADAGRPTAPTASCSRPGPAPRSAPASAWT